MKSMKSKLFDNQLIRKIFFKNLSEKISSIKLLVFDIDGVLTDGKIFIEENGNVSKSFNVKDGLATKLLLKEGIEVVFLSGSNSNSINLRAKQLGVKKCITGAKNKLKELINIQLEIGYDKDETAYVGDDLNDLMVKENVSLFMSPVDAFYEIKKRSDFILSSKGGEGVVSEIARMILQVNGRLNYYSKCGWIDNNDA